MALSLEEMKKRRPVDQAHVDEIKAQMMAEVRAYRLAEIRQRMAMTQSEVAERIGTGQRRVSKIEHGDIAATQVDTLRRYAEALGGTLRVEIEVGETRMALA